MKKNLTFLFFLLSVSMIYAQEDATKDNKNWMAQVGVNGGVTGNESHLIAVANNDINTLTVKMINFETSIHRRLIKEKNFFVGFHFNHTFFGNSDSVRDYYNGSVYQIDTEGQYTLIGIPVSYVFQKNNNSKYSLMLSIMPTYAMVNYRHTSNHTYTDVDGSGIGVRVDFAPLFHINNHLSIGPKLSIGRSSFNNIENNYYQDPEYFTRGRLGYDYAHFNFHLGVLLSLKF